ncbi:MAG: MBL fold metallo-hydrolase [Deltaproteobacteria bacterium]|nr:MBL fold metallo-hydrolase [Deltaproteobacteria bacterium]
MAFLVKFWGTRGSIPTPSHSTRRFGGNTPCVEVKVDDTLIICDGGSGLRELGVDLGQRDGGAPVHGHFFFSHAHWDHIQGFPFFMPVYSPRNTFTVYGTEEEDDRFFRLLSGQMSSEYFPVAFSDLGAKVEPASLEKQGSEIGGVLVRAFPQTHPGGSFAYSFESGGKKVVYATDHEYDLDLLNREASLENPDLVRVLGPDFIEFIRGADLLISDSQYLDEEYPSRVGWGHPRATTAVDIAVQAGVKQLALFHHDPMHSDAVVLHKEKLCRERLAVLGGSTVVFAAREGMALRLDH